MKFKYSLYLILFINIFLSTSYNLVAQERTLLWEISGKGLSKPSYLFGTVHKICKDDYFFTDSMKKYFHRSEKVCFEIDFDNPFLMFSALSGMKSDNGRTIKDLFTPSDYQKVASYFKKANGYNLDIINEYKPIVLMSMISSEFVNCYETLSYELELKKEANKFKKQIMGLETFQEQLGFISNKTEAEVVKYVLEIVNGKYIRDLDHLKLYEELVEYHKRQDIKSLYELVVNEDSSLLGSSDMILDKRNQNWIPKIENWSKDHSVFYAVGAAHLAGENGVINLLTKAGYTLKPIFSN